MGIETALLTLGAGLLGGQVLKSMQPKPPPIPQPEKPPQATKAPDRTAMLAANTAAAMPGGAMRGNSGTFLTGPAGIDSMSLNLGRNTLLGQ